MYKKCFPKKGWDILKSLKPLLAKYKAVLAGGTALSLQLGHRISVDMDFFTTVTFNTTSVISEIQRTGRNLHLLAEGERYVVTDIDGVKFSLFHYEYPFLDKTLNYEGIAIAGILDIAAMKIIAISQRGTKRDFVDTYFILQKIPFYRIAEHMVLRFGKGRVNPVLIGKGLVYFSDADSDPDPEYITGTVKWESIRTFFGRHVKQFVLDLTTALDNSR